VRAAGCSRPCSVPPYGPANGLSVIEMPLNGVVFLHHLVFIRPMVRPLLVPSYINNNL